MFDFSWSEIMVIGLVALICIGPKDMPVAIRAISRVLKKMRRMAGEFQGHLDEMMREADLQDVSATLRDIRGMNFKNAMNNLVDPDGSINRAMTEPFQERPVPPPPRWRPDVPADDAPNVMTERTVPPPPSFTAGAEAPAFIPPGARPPAPIQPAPSFVPPDAIDPHGPGF
jgi:sec-independent protein translocase protein TatB